MLLNKICWFIRKKMTVFNAFVSSYCPHVFWARCPPLSHLSPTGRKKTGHQFKKGPKQEVVDINRKKAQRFNNNKIKVIKKKK